nr:scavenger receptor cysteine-rich domain-containing protein [Endozoicomonas sp.]
MHQLCKKLSPEGRKFLEPWLQALTQIAVTAGIPNDRVTSSDRHPATRQDTHNHRVSSDSEPLYAGSVNTTESSRGCASEGNDPSCLARDSDLPALLAQREASPQTKAVILPANHTGHGLNSPMLTVDAHVRNPGKKAAATGFLEFTGAWAGEIRSFPPEQVRGHLQEAARQHLELPQKCPDMANATRIGADNRAVYLIEDDTSGWVTSPENHNQSFHYQLFLADPGSPLVAIHADGHSVPAAGLWPLAQAIQDQIKENIETLPPMAELAKNVIADGSRKESANLTFAQPKIQTQLDPEVLSKEIKNGTVLVLKPCNPITQQPETSALVFSVDHNDPNVKVNIGTEGFVEGRSLRGRRQASVKFSHSIVTHMGEIPVGRARTVVNTVCNTDKAPVINVRVSQKTDDSDAGNWPLAGEQSASIHQGQCRGFNNTLAPISPGVKTSQLDIQVNDQKQSFQIYGTGVEADSPPPLVQHIATMTLPDEYTKMSFNGNNELVTEGRGLGSYFQTEPHFTGQRQIDELEMRTNSDSLLCPGPGGTVITSGQAPSLTQRQRGKIVRQVTGKALSEPEQHLRLRDVGCPAIEGKVVGLLEAKNPAGKWGGVCQSGFGPIEGRLACETLGYPAAGAMTSVACDDDTSRVSTVVSYIRCTASDKALLDCEAISYTGSCESGNVYLACNTQPVTEPALSTSTARFRPSSDCTNFGKVDASSDIYGIVEVRRNETQSWQTACHWFFDGME